MLYNLLKPNVKQNSSTESLKKMFALPRKKKIVSLCPTNTLYCRCAILHQPRQTFKLFRWINNLLHEGSPIHQKTTSNNSFVFKSGQSHSKFACTLKCLQKSCACRCHTTEAKGHNPRHNWPVKRINDRPTARGNYFGKKAIIGPLIGGRA